MLGGIWGYGDMNNKNFNWIVRDGYKHLLYYSSSNTLAESAEYDCFRLLLIEQGIGTICFGDHDMRFSKHTLFCINERDFIQFKNCVDVKVKSIYFEPSFINDILNYENIRGDRKGFSNASIQDCYLLLSFLYREDDCFIGQYEMEEDIFLKTSRLFGFIESELVEERDMYWPCRSRSYLLELLVLITRLFDSNKNSTGSEANQIPENISSIINYLNNNYKEKITLQQLAILFTTNRTTLNNQFNKVTKLSVNEYLIEMRVGLAETMLRDSLIPISEIIYRVGFTNSSHFWRTFKKHTLYSPSEYREKYCWIKD